MCTCVSRFLPGVLPDPPVSASPGKRRSQSLSALPKDDKNSPGKVRYTQTHGAHSSRENPWLFRHKKKTFVLFTLCPSCRYFLEHRGRRITSGGPWTPSWSSASAIVLSFTSGTLIRTTAPLARSWESGGMLWDPKKNRNITTLHSRYSHVCAYGLTDYCTAVEALLTGWRKWCEVLRFFPKSWCLLCWVINMSGILRSWLSYTSRLRPVYKRAYLLE